MDDSTLNLHNRKENVIVMKNIMELQLYQYQIHMVFNEILFQLFADDRNIIKTTFFGYCFICQIKG